jgi:predicted chitinase
MQGFESKSLYRAFVTAAALYSFVSLGLCQSSGESDLLERLTPDVIQYWFPGAKQADIEKYLPPLLDALRKAKWENDTQMIAYTFATIAAENDHFSPRAEAMTTSGKYANTINLSRPFGRYDEDIATAIKLGNSIYGGKDSVRLHEMHGDPLVDNKNGELYRGRGFIQLTGRANYKKYGEAVGVGDDLEKHPEKAEDPRLASLLLVAFLKPAETAIKRRLEKDDLRGARAFVNSAALGMDRFTEVYQKAFTHLIGICCLKATVK